MAAALKEDDLIQAGLPFEHFREITAGWSGDRKYYVETGAGLPCLLRVSDISQETKRAREFHHMQELFARGIPMSEPLALGRLEEHSCVYTLLGWLPGESAEAVLPGLAESEQYRLGVHAGRILLQIHSVAAPQVLPSWQERFNAKIDRKIKMYHDCPLRFKDDRFFFECLTEESRVLLADRPQVLQHGDYHVGNMLIGDAGQLLIIDWDRMDYGDPWEEFNRIVWSAQACPAFARGQIDGYFDGAPPAEFFRLLALYLSSNQLSALAWALPFGQDEVNTMLRQGGELIEWYRERPDLIPRWYLGV